MKAQENKKGFTLIELIVVIVIIGILAAIVVPRFTGFVANSEEKLCISNRNALERHYEYCITNNNPPITAGTSVVSYLAAFPNNIIPADYAPCPSGGEITWQMQESGALILFCSEHDEIQALLTPFGNDFAHISTGFIETIQAYYAKNGKYGRNWGEYAYTDLGLNPSDWGRTKPIEHITYTAGGAQVSIRPEEGYKISLVSAVDPNKTWVMTASLNWNITYDDKTKKWYYHTIDPANVVDISTMKVYK
jgi:prepilin-type N-terminal cleavage/methylation domain-containing protein